ncbi:MAG: response regulator [Ruminococcus sp.]|nr:response regulator [Ruminococcus sp.]MBR1385187.1 response regulator [Ruminococcus sp.]
MKVLIVDDNQLLVEDLLDEMSRIVPHAQCIGTSRSEEVLRLFKEHLFDVVISDIDMPGLDGITLAKKILEVKQRTNIIYITGHEKYAVESYATFPSSFILKPVSTEKMRDAFEHLRYPVSKITDEAIEAEYSGDNVIGAKIRKAREESGISREELSEKLGVAVPTISRWENGKRLPDVITFLKLAQLFAVDPGDLMY